MRGAEIETVFGFEIGISSGVSVVKSSYGATLNFPKASLAAASKI